MSRVCCSKENFVQLFFFWGGKRRPTTNSPSNIKEIETGVVFQAYDSYDAYPKHSMYGLFTYTFNP